MQLSHKQLLSGVRIPLGPLTMVIVNPIARRCVHCKCEFLPKSHNSKFCSADCRVNPANKICQVCGVKLPSSIIINGKKHIISSRRKCLTCLPFKQEKTKVSIDIINKKNIDKSRKYYVVHRERVVAKIKKHRTDSKAKIVALTNGCQFCGYNKIQRNIAFHHVDENLKSFETSSRSFQSKLVKLLPELKKCVVVCHNCHGEIHEGLIEHELVLKANVEFATKLSTI